MSTRNVSLQFLAEVRKRRHKQRQLILLKIGGVLLLTGMGGVLLYWMQYYSWTSIQSLLIMLGVGAIAVLYIWCRITRRPMPLSKPFQRLTQGRIRYTVGLLGMALIITYQANPNLINIPAGELYTRMVYAPSPQASGAQSLDDPFLGFQSPGSQSPGAPLPGSQWPWGNDERPHPASTTIPAESETSITAVAQYILQNESDPIQQVKAIHDYVVQHLTYDQAVLKTGKRPSQEASNVFATGQAVCEGYARLFQVLGRAAGFEVVYVSGKVRRDFAPVDVIPKLLRISHPRYDWTNHAWNAVKVGDRWYLVDTTWDDGETYNTSYLMLPPTAMLASHLPKFPAWQLLKHPITRNIFEQRPLLRPSFFADQLKLLSPTTHQTRVGQTATIEIETPDNYKGTIQATYERKEQTSEPSDSSSLEEQEIPQCQPEEGNGNTIHFTCAFPDSGNYRVTLEKIEEGSTLGWLDFRVS